MNDRKINFLKSVAGPDGASALIKAVAQSPALEWALLPRSVMSWLEVMSHADYDDFVPGLNDTHLNFTKSEKGFSGCIDIDNTPYVFRDASLTHIAGSIAVALGDEAPAPPLDTPVLSKLKTSVELLVKSRTLRRIQQNQPKRKIQLPGTTAKPLKPAEPEAPQATEQLKPNIPTVGTRIAPTRAPKPHPEAVGATKPKGVKKPSLRITKTESLKPCPACGSKQFAENKYGGCICFADLSKNVNTLEVKGGYLLEFGPEWDRDALWCLYQNFGK